MVAACTVAAACVLVYIRRVFAIAWDVYLSILPRGQIPSYYSLVHATAA